jgi:hypothetical protein
LAVAAAVVVRPSAEELLEHLVGVVHLVVYLPLVEVQ